jgi:LPS export ABC transporter protein LptC
MVTRQGIFSSLILFAGVLFSTWIAIKSTVFESANQNPHLVVGIGHDLTDRQMSKEGALKSITIAQKMLHYADGSSDFFVIHGTYFNLTQPLNPPWKISGKLGFAVNDNQLLTLKDQVQVTRATTANLPALALDTSLLHYDREKNMIYTDQFVVLKEPELGNITTAIGLNAYLNENEVKLLDDIHTIYQAPAKDDDKESEAKNDKEKNSPKPGSNAQDIRGKS